MPGDNQNFNLNQVSSTISSQYSQFGNFLDSLSDRNAKEAGKKIAKEIINGLEDGLKNTSSLKGALDGVEREFEKYFQDISKKNGMAFDVDKLKSYQKYLKDIAEDKRKLTNIEKALSEEQKKSNPDVNKLLDLEKQRVEASNKALELANSQKLIAQQILLEEQKRVANNQMINAQNEQERKAAEEHLKNIQQKSNSVSDNLADITHDIKQETEDVSNLLDEAKEKLEKGGKTFEESLKGVRDTISSVAGSINSIVGAMSAGGEIDRWAMSLDKYTSQSILMGNAFGTGYAGSSSFESLKNSLIDAMNESGYIYNQEQQLALMKDLTGFSFANNETAIQMANDLAFAKEYMGQSVESLQSMYALQVRTNQDDFLKRSLNTIAALQRTGNSLSEAQLEAASQQSMTLTQKLMNMGMSGTAASQAYEQIMAMSVTADQVYGKGMGQQIVDTISNSLSLDALGGIGLSNPDAAIRQLQQGNVTGYWNAIMNSQSARASSASRSNMSGLNGIAMGSENVFGGTLNDNLIRQLTDPEKTDEFRRTLQQKLDDIANNTNALEENKNEVEDVESEYYKNANAVATNLTKLEWDNIANGIARAEFWEKLTNSLLNKMDAIIAVVSLTSTISNLFGGSLGKAGSSLITKAGGLGKVALGGVGLAAGAYSLYSMGKDAFNVASNGWTDASGNLIDTGGTGFGDSVAAAFSNSNLNASTGSNAFSGTLKGAGIGAALGTIIPGVGTIVGGVIGAGVGAIGGLIASGYKDRKRAEAAALAEQKKANEILTKTASNVETIKNSRDVALSNRYDDGRYTGGGLGGSVGDEVFGVGGPISKKEYKYGINSGYGVRKDPFTGQEAGHDGYDLAFPYKTPIGAAMGGTVITSKAGYNGGIGQYIEIKGDDGMIYRYGHLNTRYVSVGDTVYAGQKIALSGGIKKYDGDNAGRSTGQHLHFAVKTAARKSVDPGPYVTSELFNISNTPPVTSSISNGTDSTLGALIMGTKTGEAYSTSALPSFYNTGGNVSDDLSGGAYDTIAIVKGLATINETLLAIDKRQSDQQKILDALTQTPIHNLGV